MIQRGAAPDFYDSLELVQKMFFNPDGSKLFAFVQNQIFYKNYPSGNWVKIHAFTPGRDTFQYWFDYAFIPGSNTDFFATSSDWKKKLAYLKRFTYNGSGYTSMNVPGVPDWDTVGTDLVDICPRTSNTMYVMLRDDAIVRDDRLYLYTYDPGNTNDPGSFQYISRFPNHFPNTRFRGVVGSGIQSSVKNPGVVYYNTEVPYISRDSGKHMVQIGTYYSDTGPTHADIRACYIQHSEATATDNGTMDRVYLATDGGVSLKPRGKSILWRDKTTVNINGKGLNIGHFSGVSVSEDGGQVFQGSFHYGFHAYEPGETQKWAHFPGGDGHNVVFSRTNQKMALARDLGLGVRTTKDVPATTRIIDSTLWSYPLPVNSVTKEKRRDTKTPIWPDQFGNIYVGLSNQWAHSPVTDTIHQISGQGVDPNLPAGLQDILLRSGDPTEKIPATHATDFSPYYTSPVGYVAYEGPELYYRSPNAISGFLEITNAIKQQTDRRPIVDLAMDPRQPDRVWVAIGGPNFHPVPTERVVYSPDGGVHWLDVSKGLPRYIPVTNIVFHEGANVLYASTDAGVYKLDMSGFTYSDINNDMSGYHSVEWKCFNKGAPGSPDLPQAFITELEINYCQGRLYAATFGRSTWYTNIVVDPYPANNPPTFYDEFRPAPQEVISSTPANPWTGEIYIPTGITIKSGATLTIGNAGGTATTVHMPRNGMIFVEKGGTLIVDGAKITNSCEDCMWAGISVQGTNHAPQTLTYQGKLVLKNGAVLEHARVAVGNSYIEDPSRHTRTGGIIQASRTTFLNNGRAAEFLAYNDVSTLNDLSYFRSCRFEINDAYKGAFVGYPFEHHVTLWDVHGVEFNGCTFVNNHTTSQKNKGDGIYAYNASFYARPYPTNSQSGNRFDSLKHGIVVDGDMYGWPLSPIIDRNSFSANSVGLKIINLPHVSAIRNTFTVGNGKGIDVFDCEDNIGIYTLNTPQFRIEENAFNGATGAAKVADHAVGTLVDNSGINDKELYKNRYTNLDYGVYAQGKNTSYIGKFPSDQTGLRIICNIFTTNSRDIYVNGDPLKQEGICYMQGYYTKVGGVGKMVSAGNRFMPGSLPPGSPFPLGIANMASSLNYFHDNNSISRPQSTLGYVALFQADIANECVSRLSTLTAPDRPVELTGDMKAAMKKLFRDSKSQRDSRQHTWAEQIDNGSTNDRVEEVIGMRGMDAMNYLLAYSPYLSSTVIKEVATRGIMDKSMLKQVLIENPDVVRDMRLTNYLSSAEVPDPLTEEDMYELFDATLEETPRTRLEAEISFHQANMSHAVNLLLTDIKSKEKVTEADSILVWLDRTEELWAQYQTVNYLRYKGKTENASRLMWELHPENYTTDEDANHEHDYLIYIYEVLAGIRAFDADVLTDILNDEAPNSSSLAASILSQIGYYRRPCVELPLNSYRMPEPQIRPSVKQKASAFKVYPNPAKEYAIFEYKLENNADPILVTITNIVGQQVGSFELKSNSTGKYYWDIRRLPAGSYFYKANNDKKDYGSGKIVVVH